MWRGTGSLPSGQATCRPCRRQANGRGPEELLPRSSQWQPERRRCRCGKEFTQRRYNQRYCSPECKPSYTGRKVATPEERGYGKEHARLRREWAKIVAQGNTHCWRCGTWIDPAEPWHLGHDDHDRSIYRGPECVHCNTSTAASRGNRAREAKVKTCATCGNAFATTYPKQLYCTHECRPKRKRKPKRWAAPNPMLSPCQDCGSLHTRRSSRCERCVAAQRLKPEHLCQCGATIPGRRRYCDACRTAIKKQAARDYANAYRKTARGKELRRAQKRRARARARAA